MRTIILALALTLIAVSHCQTNTCNPACGGNTENDCSDFDSDESLPSNCYSCAAGYIGGAKQKSDGGKLCVPGRCNSACASCHDSSADFCYLCSYKFYDSAANPTRATPCSPCHPSCLSCAGPTANDCLICAPGLFDSLQNPYVPGSCEPCDSKCSYCQGERKNCVEGCCDIGFHHSSSVNPNCVIKELC